MNYSFILDDMRYSYSSATSYETCPGGFKLAYIDAEERDFNAFSDFGNFVHKILEMYFKDEIEIEDMPEYYSDNYGESVKTPFPPYPAGMSENYFNAGLEFFKNFKFDKNDYDIIFIEDFINAVYHGVSLTVKPDLILRDKKTGKYLLVDYKTAKIKSGKSGIAQLNEYKRQFLLYTQFLWWERDINISKIIIWFIRDQKEVIIDVDPNEAIETVQWFEETVDKIKKEENWNFNNTKENLFFCQNICSMRSICPMFV